MRIQDLINTPGTEREFPAETDALEPARAFVEEELERSDCPMKASTQILIALEEMFVNVASYAYEGMKKGTVCLRTAAVEGGFLLTLRDRGVPFNPLTMEDPDTSLPAGERQIGGLGVFMTKKLMDEVFYVRENGENIFSMLKLF